VNAAEVPRFYPNAVTLTATEADRAGQLETIEILQKSNLPGRWAVKDSFNTLDLGRRGFDVLLEASWIRAVVPMGEATAGIEWRRETEASTPLPFGDDNFAMFTGVGYESGAELSAALDAGFELGDPLKVWVRSRD